MSFTQQLDKIILETENQIRAIVRATALAIDQAVVLATPVKTGRARSNWLVGLDSPRTEIVDRTNPQLSLDDALKQISQYQLGQSIFLSNNLPYIRRLNEGWSKQAPANFIEKAVEAGVQTVRQARF